MSTFVEIVVNELIRTKDTAENKEYINELEDLLNTPIVGKNPVGRPSLIWFQDSVKQGNLDLVFDGKLVKVASTKPKTGELNLTYWFASEDERRT